MTRFLSAALLAATAMYGQSFDAASVKPAEQQTGLITPVMSGNPSRLTLRNFSLKNLILEAYGVSPYQVQGPAWMARDRYDIIANRPIETTKEQTRGMMRSLLAERFHLGVHSEKKEMPAWVLLPGKDTSKLRPAKDVPDVPGCKSFGTMSDLAKLLASQLDAPVAEETGIAGAYYFMLAWSPNLTAPGDSQLGPGAPPPPPPPPAAPPPCPGWSSTTMPTLASSIFEAVREQMGLRLERRGSTQVDVLVVDHADRTPVKN